MSIPEGIVPERDRDLVGRAWEIWMRRGLMALMPAVALLALLNVFGQHPETSTASSPAASLVLSAPSRVRGGLLFQARFNVNARSKIKSAILVLDPGWLEGMTTNTIQPEPESVEGRDGRLVLHLGEIERGHSFVLFMQFQANPTYVGHREQTVRLFDGSTKLAQINHNVTVFP
jgi:hypothetical protein